MAPVPPGEPRPALKPQPLGNFLILFLFTTCTICLVFVLWRRADALRTIVSHQLRTWTHQEGAVRLSEDGPPAREFLDDDYDDEAGVGDDDQPLAVRAERLRQQEAAGKGVAPGDRSQN